jgi:hypothetical protein
MSRRETAAAPATIQRTMVPSVLQPTGPYVTVADLNAVIQYPSCGPSIT